MRTKVISIPAAIVCGISILVFAVNLGFGIFSALKARWPEQYMDPEAVTRFASNDAYWRFLLATKSPLALRGRPSEFELLRHRNDEKNVALLEIKHTATQDLTHQAVWALLFGILAASSWSVVKRYAPDRYY